MESHKTHPPRLDELFGEWMPVDQLEHLPSMRNPWGQGHVNHDLSSLSWLAFPPITLGYSTGVLRVDGVPAGAERFRWLPSGVQRECNRDDVRIVSDVRFVAGEPAILWRITMTNNGDAPRTLVAQQELAAMVATSEVDWGWLYGSPFNNGHYHDFFATEKVRAEVLVEDPRQTQLIPEGERRLRLGKPRIAGIQRDEDDVAMLLETALPAHTTSDRIESNLLGAPATVKSLSVTNAAGATETFLTAETEVPKDFDAVVGVAELAEGSVLDIEFRLDEQGATGVIFTHGNHPDSLQLGMRDGALWMSVGGEIVNAGALAEGWHRVSVAMSTTAVVLTLDEANTVSTGPWWVSDRWSAAINDSVVTVTDSVTGAAGSYAFGTAPSSVELDGSRGIAVWNVTLEPGETQEIDFALDLSTTTGDRARALASDFAAEFSGVENWWDETWESAFTPGNAEFSGYVPLLDADEDLEKTYYTSILEVIYVRNKYASPFGPIYLTGGPRLGPTTTFFWDIVEWARIFAMLDPAAMRSWILAALGTPYDQSFGFDCKNVLPLGNYYSANDYSLFRTVEHYVGVTGDVAILDEVTGGRSVHAHIREMAFRPDSRRAEFGDGVLVDFGDDPWELLEAVPNYRHAVVSFNAGYVRLLESFATIAENAGHTEDAALARAKAAELAKAVLGQYAGAGRWLISFPDHDETIGHCLDFQIVAGELAAYLPDTMKEEMVTFVTEHLLDGDWMLALAQDDPIAPFSDRPDHGDSGAFIAWPADTAYGLSRLGRKDLARDLLRVLHRSTSGGLWGQAQEARRDGTFFVSERGVHCRECAAGGSMAESVIAGLFDFGGGYAALSAPSGSLEFDGARLTNIRAIGFDLPAVNTK